VIIAFVVAFITQDKSGYLAPGAIANLVDEIGASVIHKEGVAMSVSVNMSISYLSTAKVNVSDLLFLAARLYLVSFIDLYSA